VEKDWVMPGVVRVGKDVHVGHASGTPNPFHKTSYATGSSNVISNGAKTVRGAGVDRTACGDPAIGLSSNVIINGTGVHRLNDATAGHGSWVGNKAASGSQNVIANGGSGAEATTTIPVTIYQYERADTTDPVQPYNTPSAPTRSINFGIQLSSGSVMDSTGTSLTKSNLSPHTPDQINTKLSGI
jgi:hypothetical protein